MFSILTPFSFSAPLWKNNEPKISSNFKRVNLPKLLVLQHKILQGVRNLMLREIRFFILLTVSYWSYIYKVCNNSLGISNEHNRKSMLKQTTLQYWLSQFIPPKVVLIHFTWHYMFYCLSKVTNHISSKSIWKNVQRRKNVTFLPISAQITSKWQSKSLSKFPLTHFIHP